jgi:KUP system potassium uptake protein
MSSSDEHGNKNLYALALGAIGVVYGDIGTSPLYTLKEAFGPHGVAVNPENVLGVLSLIFWSLIVVVSIKYATFIMSADNKGEGGIMALTTLAHRGVRSSARARWFIMVLGLFGAALFFGDSVITPAMSVLSAVEGIKVATPALNRFVVPIAVVVLIALFSLQRSGTARVARVFAPIMVIWFLSLAVLGVVKIVQAPQVLEALSPYYAVEFFYENGRLGFFALASVILALTGAEALYADMGHFGKRPIRRAWFAFVLPALMLNYFGQGALLLTDPAAAANPFYLLVPPVLLYPMIGLATLAAVIASQAVISGAFSVTRQAIQLGYLPRMEVVHTSRETMGPTNLAAAYGIAVIGTMTIDSVLVMIVARRIWAWKRWHVAALGGLFLVVDLAFLGANLEKVEHGGWFPLVLGLVVFTIMTTWRRGRELVIRELKTAGLALKPFIESIAEHPPLRVPGQAVFLTAQPDAVPHALLHNLKHNKVLHEQNVVLTVEWLETPTAEPEERIELVSLGHEFHQLTLRYGFAEDPDVPDMLARCEKVGLVFDMMDTTFFLSRESIVATDRQGMPLWRDKLFAFMQRNALPATAFFQIPGNRLIELGTQVEI